MSDMKLCSVHKKMRIEKFLVARNVLNADGASPLRTLHTEYPFWYRCTGQAHAAYFNVELTTATLSMVVPSLWPNRNESVV